MSIYIMSIYINAVHELRNMAARYCASSLCVYFTYLSLLLIVFDAQHRYLTEVHSNELWNRAVELQTGSEIMKFGWFGQRPYATKTKNQSIDQNFSSQCVRFCKPIDAL